MPAIIPIPAFTDNYIWILREGRDAAVVDPGDAAPVSSLPRPRRTSTLTGIVITHHHWDHVGGIAALAARVPVPVFGPAHESIPGAHSRARPRATRSSSRVPASSLRVLDVPGHTAGQHAYVGANDGRSADVHRRHAVRLRLWPVVRRHAGADGCLAREARGAAGRHPRLLRARVHARQPRFALAVEPGNPALRERQIRERAKRERGEPTVPSTDRRRARDQSFPARRRAESVRGRARRTPAGLCRTRSMPLPRCAMEERISVARSAHIARCAQPRAPARLVDASGADAYHRPNFVHPDD